MNTHTTTKTTTTDDRIRHAIAAHTNFDPMSVMASKAADSKGFTPAAAFIDRMAQDAVRSIESATVAALWQEVGKEATFYAEQPLTTILRRVARRTYEMNSYGPDDNSSSASSNFTNRAVFNGRRSFLDVAADMLGINTNPFEA